MRPIKKMKNTLLTTLIIILLGCTATNQETTQNTQGHSYNIGTNTFNYTKDNETHTNLPLKPNLMPAMEWIRNNTEEQAVFLNWWDHGHMIQGIGRRETIINAPSKQILNTVSKYAGMSQEELNKIECPECNNHENVMDVVNSLITTKPETLRAIMHKHNSTHILITQNDYELFYALFLIAGLEPYDYLNQDLTPKQEATNTTLYKIIEGREIKGLRQAYSDETARIYTLS